MSDNDHRHEAYDVYGMVDLRADVRELTSVVGGLRADLNGTLGRLSDMGDALEAAAGVIRELREDVDGAEARIGRLSERVQVLEAERDAAE